jgi:hypothetical protein
VPQHQEFGILGHLTPPHGGLPGRRRPDRPAHSACPPSALISPVPFQASGYSLPELQKNMPRLKKCKIAGCLPVAINGQNSLIHEIS